MGKPPHAGPTSPPATFGGQIRLRCTYCHDAFAERVELFCAACLAPHHTDCHAEHGACAAPACGETRTVRSGIRRPFAWRFRRTWRMPWINVTALGVAGVLAMGLIAGAGWGLAWANSQEHVAWSTTPEPVRDGLPVVRPTPLPKAEPTVRESLVDTPPTLASDCCDDRRDPALAFPVSDRTVHLRCRGFPVQVDLRDGERLVFDRSPDGFTQARRIPDPHGPSWERERVVLTANPGDSLELQSGTGETWFLQPTGDASLSVDIRDGVLSLRGPRNAVHGP